MYSKNDYRYYLEHRMAEENYLAHYGVKGMKWKVHKINYNTGDTSGRGFEISNNSTRQSYGIHYATYNKGKGKALVYTKQNPQEKNSGKFVDKTKGRLNTFGDKSYKEVTLDLSKKKKKKLKLKNPLAPKNQKVEVTDLKNEKTGEVYKSSKKKTKKSKNPLAPKNQKVEVITNKKKKRSKREAKWNKQMQNYGKEILSEKNR